MSTDYGPIQLARHLGLSRGQFDRACRWEIVPAPDRDGRRWSPEAIAGLDRDRLLAQVGHLPDVGAVRAAEEIATAVGIQVQPDAIAELARWGHLRVVGTYRDHLLYDGGDLENVIASGDADLLARAEQAGQLHTTDQAATVLGLRRCDVQHLVRAGYLPVATWVHHPMSRRSGLVALYRQADLDQIATTVELDLDAARHTPAGRRSPLAQLPTASA